MISPYSSCSQSSTVMIVLCLFADSAYKVLEKLGLDGASMHMSCLEYCTALIFLCSLVDSVYECLLVDSGYE